MSSSPIDLTSTTASSTSSPFPAEPSAGRSADVAIIACGAISQPCQEIVGRRGWSADVYPLPPLLHNRPEKIAAAVEELAVSLGDRYSSIAIGYADCGTYGALDEVCDRLGMRRLAGMHCYDVFAGQSRLQEFFEAEPGTYVFTDFLVKSFARTVVAELGLDRFPELRDTYFGNYTRVVWLAQERSAELESLANKASEAMGLPLKVIDVGYSGLEDELEALLTAQR